MPTYTSAARNVHPDREPPDLDDDIYTYTYTDIYTHTHTYTYKYHRQRRLDLKAKSDLLCLRSCFILGAQNTSKHPEKTPLTPQKSAEERTSAHF